MLNLYPTFPSQSYSIFRAPFWHTRIQQAESKLERRLADQPSPISEWTLTYELMREAADTRQSGGGLGTGYDELYTLAGFYLQQNGPLIPFLWNDPTDCYMTAGPLGIGDGVTRAFQFVRQQGSLMSVAPYFEPIQYLNAVGAVYVDNVSAAGTFTIQNPGAFVVFTSAPASGAVITADFTYFWPVRFSDPTLSLENFMYQLWTVKTVKFRQILFNVVPQ